MNAHFIGQDGVETGFDGTWMSALGMKWNEGFNTRQLTVTVKQVISTLFEGNLKTSFPLVSEEFNEQSFFGLMEREFQNP